MRSAVVASSILALSLFGHRAEAGFPYSAYTLDAPDARIIGPQFGTASVPQRLPPAVRPAAPTAHPQRRAQRPGPRVPRFPIARPTRSPRPQYRIAQFDENRPQNVPQYGAPYSPHGPQHDSAPFPSTTPQDTVESAENESPGEVPGDAIVAGHEDVGHVHGPGCATGDGPSEIVHSDELLHSQPESHRPAHPQPVYQTHEVGCHDAGYGYTAGGCYDSDCGYDSGYSYDAGCGCDSRRYYDAMSAPSWDYGRVDSGKNCPTWFGGVYGLIMTRNGDENDHFLGNSADPSLLYLCSSEFETGYSGGVEARIGRTFNCCRWGLEMVYWGLFPGDEQAQFTGAAMTTVLDYGYVYDPLGTPLSNYTDALVYGRARRFEEYHNIEINLLSGPLTLASPGGCCSDACGNANSSVVGYDGGYGGGTYRGAGYPTYEGCRGGCSGESTTFRPGCGDGYGQGFYGQGCGNSGCTQPRWMANWVFGVRYFKLNEQVLLDYSSVGPQINGATGEVYHDYDAENNLVGVQLGVDLNYCLTKRLNLDFGSKFGLFGNHMSSRQRIHTPDGLAYVLPSNPTDFNVHNSENNVAFLGELRVGLGCQVGRHLRFTGGYRAIAASGVATALGQKDFGRELGALGKVADVDSGDSIVLHGAYVGSEFAW